VTDLVFFYGTLMSCFRPAARSMETRLTLLGRGTIGAAMFDIGVYPAAVPSTGSRIHGEIHRMLDSSVLVGFDEIEGCHPGRPDRSLYLRAEVPVTFDDGRVAAAWVYFYNAPLGGAARIASGDYLEYLKVKQPDALPEWH
jgi:gamma-glutamylcyclotransferase (GGCT)/AIG2-like uncharacterized protein YtfP